MAFTPKTMKELKNIFTLHKIDTKLHLVMPTFYYNIGIIVKIYFSCSHEVITITALIRII